MLEKCKKKASELALKSTFSMRHGAVIAYNGHIIGSGFNVNMDHPDIKQFNEFKTLHAEMVAVFRVKNKRILKRAEMYVCRINRNGNYMLSKPCNICQRIMKSFGIKTVHYTNGIGEWVTEVL